MLGPRVPRNLIILFFVVIFMFYSLKQIQWYIICYINYVVEVICVLAVGDDELGVGDDDDALSEVASRNRARENCWGWLGTGEPGIPSTCGSTA